MTQRNFSKQTEPQNTKETDPESERLTVDEEEQKQKQELDSFFADMRDPHYAFHQLFPLLESCNKQQKVSNKKNKSDAKLVIHDEPLQGDKNRMGQLRKQKESKMKNEIYIPVEEVTALAVGDDNVLSRQYRIDNTITLLLKEFDTHDFYMQINDSERSVNKTFD